MIANQLKFYFVAAFICGAVLTPGFSSRAVFAQEKSSKNLAAELSTREAYVGQPIILRVEITNAKQFEPPRLPDIDGLDIRSGGTPSRSSRISIYNGRRTESSSITYVFQVTPLREGDFKLPSIDIQIDGDVQSTG